MDKWNHYNNPRPLARIILYQDQAGIREPSFGMQEKFELSWKGEKGKQEKNSHH